MRVLKDPSQSGRWICSLAAGGTWNPATAGPGDSLVTPHQCLEHGPAIMTAILMAGHRSYRESGDRGVSFLPVLNNRP